MRGKYQPSEETTYRFVTSDDFAKSGLKGWMYPYGHHPYDLEKIFATIAKYNDPRYADLYMILQRGNSRPWLLKTERCSRVYKDVLYEGYWFRQPPATDLEAINESELFASAYEFYRKRDRRFMKDVSKLEFIKQSIDTRPGTRRSTS